MKTKKTFLKIGIFAIFMWIFGLSFTSASAFTRFKIDLSKSPISAVFESDITRKIMYVHFADNGNDFGGILYFSNIWEQDTCEEGQPEDCLKPSFEVSINDIDTSDRINYRGKLYECRKHTKWFYYNSQRGERLRPLDEETASIWGSGYKEFFTWWIYTNCTEKWYYDKIKECGQEGNYNDVVEYEECINNANKEFSADGNGYFGSVSNTYSWQEMTLVMWVNYTGTDVDYNWFISIESGSKLAPTFARLGNRYPVWFVYDYNGWLGLAWCRITGEFAKQSMKVLYNEYYGGGSEGLSNIFNYNEENDKVEYVPGSVGGVSCEPISQADTLLRIVIEWVVWMSETASRTTNTIYWTMGNSSNSKMQQFATRDINRNTLMNYVRKKAELLCRWKWKKFEDSDCSSLPQLVCDSWEGNRQCNDNELRGKTVIVKKWDFAIPPDENSTNELPYDIYVLSWDLKIIENDSRLYVFNESGYIISISTWDFNDAVSTANGFYSWGNWATVASFLKWNFVVNWNVKWSSDDLKLKHKYFIYGKFSSIGNVDDLEETFARRCYNGSGSDGYYCPQYPWNSYWNASLIVKDQNYSSPVLN